MPSVLNFYMDDSGTRAPNRKPLAYVPGVHDCFALGGVLVREEEEARVRAAHEEFCHRWSIEYPLHSVEIRHRSHKFSWLKRDEVSTKFMRDLTRMLTSVDVLGIACVVDRPGYDARYRERYGRRQWHLCQTAFCISVERAAKHAHDNRRKLRVLPERSGPKDERRLKRYFGELKANGLPFDQQSSARYSPMAANELNETLYEIRFKWKSSPMAQLADLYLWPMVMAGYNEDYRAYVALRDAGRLIECHLPAERQAERGTKYSCFELVRQHRREQ